MSKTSDDSLLAAGAGDKIVLFEMIYSSLAILTFVEKHPAYQLLIKYKLVLYRELHYRIQKVWDNNTYRKTF